MAKAKQCALCKHFYCDDDWNGICKLGYKPRFFQPRSPIDNGWGWKRQCDDYVAADIEGLHDG